MNCSRIGAGYTTTNFTSISLTTPVHDFVLSCNFILSHKTLFTIKSYTYKDVNNVPNFNTNTIPFIILCNPDSKPILSIHRILTYYQLIVTCSYDILSPILSSQINSSSAIYNTSQFYCLNLFYCLQFIIPFNFIVSIHFIVFKYLLISCSTI